MKCFRCFSALKCFNVTRCGHHPKRYPNTPEYWYRRKSGQFDKFFYRYVTSSKEEYRVSTRHWSMDHQLESRPGSKTLKLIPGPLRTQDKPTFYRSDFDIKDHNFNDLHWQRKSMGHITLGLDKTTK